MQQIFGGIYVIGWASKKVEVLYLLCLCGNKLVNVSNYILKIEVKNEDKTMIKSLQNNLLYRKIAEIAQVVVHDCMLRWDMYVCIDFIFQMLNISFII